MTARVEYADAEPNGLAAMLGGLIEANLAQDPSRERLLKPGVAAITAPDADVSVTLRMRPGVVRVSNGLPSRRGYLHVRADSSSLIELSSVPLRFGLPDSFTKEGRRTTRKLLKGEIKVRGMLSNVGTLTRLNRLLAVAPGA